MPRKVKVAHAEHGELEFDADAVEFEVARGEGEDPVKLRMGEVLKGYVPQTAFENEVNRRVEAGVKTKTQELRTSLLDDEEFRTGALKKWNIDPNAKPGEKPDLERMQSEWRDRELKPVKTELEKREQRIQSLLSGKRDSQIVRSAAAHGVKKRYLNPTAEGADPLVVAMFAHMFGYDEQTDDWYVKNGDSGFAFGKNPTTGKPYRTVDEAIEDWASKPENKEFLDDNRQGGPGFGEPGGSGGVVRMTREQALNNPKAYHDAREKAAKEGRRLEIVQE